MGSEGHTAHTRATIIGNPNSRFSDAVAHLGSRLHAEIKAVTGLDARNSCVISSLVAGEFFNELGFKDAALAPAAVIFARNGIAEATLGFPSDASFQTGRWQGHAVAIIPSAGYLVETTIAERLPAGWKPVFGSVVAAPLLPAESSPIAGFTPLADIKARTSSSTNYICWLHTPKNDRWKLFEDARNSTIRRRIVSRLLSC